jgi:hypothetical protein
VRAVVLGLLLVASVAQADPKDLRAAQSSFTSGEYEQAATLAGELVGAGLSPAERSEAWRIYGLSLYFLGRRTEADAALLSYLKLDPDARLDPALIAPDAVVFFEEVRTRHAGEILAAKPRRPRRHLKILNFLPPAGQFQNGQRAKGWVLGALEVTFLATNLTTFALLSTGCDSDLTCGDGPANLTRARTLRTVNLVSGALFLGTYLYGVIDGYASTPRSEPEWAISAGPTEGGTVFVLSGRF